jgi:hypothetical protein
LATGVSAVAVVGGKTFNFVLSKTGTAGKGVQTFKIVKITKGYFASTMGTFTLTLKNQALAQAFTAYGATNATVKAPGTKVTFPIAVDIGGKSYVGSANVLYTAKSGKGKGKSVVTK